MVTGAALYTTGAYASSYPSWHAEDAEWKAANIVRMLHQNQVEPDTIIEIGCGAGGVLSGVVRAFPQARGSGFDISPHAIAMAKDQPGNVRFECADFLSLDYVGYEVLLCIDVFEHVDDYLGFLRAIRTRAGLFVFHIPLDMNIKGLLRGHHITERNKTGHLHYFDYMTALATLKDTGYRVIDRFYTAHPADGTLLTKVVSISRRLMTMATGEDRAVQVLGGASLLVLAKGDG